MYDGDELMDVREVSLNPFETRSRSFIMLPVSEVIRCEIDSNDALKNDNCAYFLVEREQDISVLLVTPGNIFLTKALVSSDGTNVAIVSPSNYTGSMSENPDVIIFDRCGEVHYCD